MAIAVVLCVAGAGLTAYRVVHPAICPTRPAADVLAPQVDGAVVSEADVAPEECELVLDVASPAAKGNALSVAVRRDLERSGWQLEEDTGSREVDGAWYALALSQEVPDHVTLRVLPAPVGPPPRVWTGARSPRAIATRVVAITSSGVIGFDPSTTQPVWSRSCPHADWASPYASPEVDVAVAVCAGRYVGIDGLTGALLWSHPTLADVERSRVAGASLLLCAKSYLQVIDVHTGDNRWRRPEGECAASANHGQVFVDSVHQGVIAFDERTGEVQFFGAGDPSYAVLGLDDGVVSRTDAHAVERFDKHDGTQVWKSAEEASRLNSSGFRGATDHAVVLESRRVGTQYTAYDRGTGALLWTRDDPGGDDSSMGGDLVAISQDAHGEGPPGTIVVLDDRSGAQRASYDDAVAPGVATMGAQVAYFAGTVDAPQLVVRVVP